MYNLVFYIIVGILLFGYLLDQFLDYLNSKMWSDELPAELADIYDKEKYKKSQQYDRANKKISFLSSTFNLALMLAMMVFGGFAFVDELSRGIVQNYILIALLFFGILMLASDFINTPFSVYDTFVIEEKFGFNKTTAKTFILDKIKGWLLTVVIGGGLLAVVIWFYLETTHYFWLFAWGLATVFGIFMTMFYSTLIVPLFNKQVPLEKGELRDAIEEFCKKADFKLDNVFVIDGSKRSTKANAYFSGLGPKKRIVLFDTLIEDLSTDEIVAVLAHEIGHNKKKHTLWMILFSVLQNGITLFILSLFIGKASLSKALQPNLPEIYFHLGLIAFGILYSPISMIVGLFGNMFSRKNEYQADRFAARFGKGEALGSALKKLSVKNLSNLSPHPAYVFFHYSHPPLLQRLGALKEK